MGLLFLTTAERTWRALNGCNGSERIMKKGMMLLVAVLTCGMELEAELWPNENVEDAKKAMMVNYHLSCGEVKAWRVQG